MKMWKVYRQTYNVSLKNTLVILLTRSIVDRLYVLKYICTYITSTLTSIFGNYGYVHLHFKFSFTIFTYIFLKCNCNIFQRDV